VIKCYALIAAGAALIACPLPAADWISLFDGRTLDGWHIAAKPADRDRGFWKVADGAITCDSRGRTDHDYVWLISDREYGDFELRVKVRGFRDSTGNSGVQVRSRYDEEEGWLHGPQIDVHPPAPWRTGLIYDETRGVQRWIFPSLKNWEIDDSHAPKGSKWNADDWNELQIVCRGTRITTRLNGVLAADLDGNGILDDEAHRKHNVGLKGCIALQLHSKDDLYIQYKDLRLRPIE
jgi:Domain of Unknown Function (DUF1080)